MKTTKSVQGTMLVFLMALLVISPLNLYAVPGNEVEKSFATDPEDDVKAVEQVVYDLFDAMRAGDGEKVKSLFVEGTILQSTGERDGKPMLGKVEAVQFAQAVGNAEGPMWDEKIWNLQIQVKNRLASAWMDYAFYLGEDFSHCGVNSFQLFKGEEGWKIIYLADTRQKEGCEIPESVKPGVN